MKVTIGGEDNELELDNCDRNHLPTYEARVVIAAKNISPDSFLGKLARQKTLTQLEAFILRCVVAGAER